MRRARPRATAAPRPTAPTERIVSVDVLRGVAVLGILLVNMLWFASPDLYLQQMELEWWTAPRDRAADALIRFAAEGKFIAMFSFLFGLGTAIQMERARARGGAFGPLYLRRLLGLLAIGLGHALLLWHGDILTAYALLGFLLLLFRRRDDVELLTWAAVLVAVPVLFLGAVHLLMILASHSPDAAREIQDQMARQQAAFVEKVERSVEAYRDGGYREAFHRRIADLSFQWGYFFLWLPPVFGLFLVGLWAGRARILAEPHEHRDLLRKVAAVGLLAGGVANGLYAWGTIQGATATDGSLLGLVAMAAHTVGAPVLAFGYMAALLLLLERPGWTRRLRPFAAVGRMALTNYLAQTVIATTLFYGYGLGLYGRVGPAAGLLLTLGIFALQLAWSPWWLRRFRYGPVEWAWRSATYGRLEPFRKRAVTEAG